MDAPDPVVAVRTLARLARVLENGCDGLTFAQYRVLARVAAGADRASRLSAHLDVAKPTITAVVDGLVAAGHLTRTTDPEDRRVFGLALTPSGADALVVAEASMAERLGGFLSVVEDPAAFVTACAAIHDELEARAADRHAARSGAVPSEALELDIDRAGRDPGPVSASSRSAAPSDRAIARSGLRPVPKRRGVRA